jgi:hypothetical protein
MLNKENPNYNTGSATGGTKEKEAEHKQFAKPGSKSEGGPCKSENKPQQNKAQPGAKPGHKECSGTSEEDEECGSSSKFGK